MKRATFSKINDLAKCLSNEAKMISQMFGSNFPISDWKVESKSLIEIMKDNAKLAYEYPYYIAFRSLGCEGGTRHEVFERCAVLGGVVSMWTIRYNARADKFELNQEQ